MANSKDDIRLRVGYDIDQSSLKQVSKSLQNLQNIKPSSFKGTKDQLDQVKETAKKVEQALTSAFNVKLNSVNISQFNQNLETARLDINKIYTEFSKAGTQGKVAFSQMASSVLNTNLQLKQTHSLINSMGETMANTVKWGIASSVMNSFTSSVQQAFQYVKSLDSALTDIRIVTGDSAEQMQNFAVQANQAAQALGRSTMDYSKAALTFYQQGLDEQAVQARTQATLQAQNITGAGDEMADYLTAVWNGYKVANEEAELYVDKLAAVADSSASNMSQLAIAMSKVASTANAMGVDVDSLNAQIATIVATTRQAPESVGNALKTIYARINDIATGADGAEVSLGNYSEKMAQVGFSVLDANGNLRDTGDVIDQIGGKWQDLSREQQIYLARTMAGQRQYNNLIALFDNWSKYSDLVNVSMQSQGSLVQKNSIYMESLGAKMQQLGAAGERVKDALINEEDLKGIIELGTGLTNLLGNFIESIGGGRNALLTLGSTAVQVFSGTIAKEISKITTNFHNEQANKAAKQLQIGLTKEFAQSQGYSEKVIENLVNAKRAGQEYYDYMNQAQISEYSQLVDTIAKRQQEVQILKSRQEAAQKMSSLYNDLDSEGLNKISQNANGLREELESFHTLNFESPKQALSELKRMAGQLANTLGGQDQATQYLGEDNIYAKAISQITDQTNPAITQVNAVKNALLELTRQIQQTGADASGIDNLNNQLKDAQKNLDLANQSSKSFLQNIKDFAFIKTIAQGVSGLGQFAAGLNNIVNLTKIWKNENLSLGQKLIQTFSNVGMTFTLMLNSISKIREGYIAIFTKLGEQTYQETKINLLKDKQLITERLITAQKEKQAFIDKYGKEAIPYLERYNSAYQKIIGSIQADNVALAENTALIEANEGAVVSYGQTTLSSYLPMIGVAAGVALAIYGIYRAWTADARAAQKATETAQRAKKSYDQVKESADNLKSSLTGYNEAVDNLDKLTKGTQQWKEALIQVNDKVLELLDEFPELAQYISTTSDGMLQISSTGQDAILSMQQQRVQGASLSYINAERASLQANNTSAITDFYRDNVMLTARSDADIDITPKEFQRTIEAIQTNGHYLLDNSEELSKVANITSNQAERIVNLKDQIIPLISSLDANTSANNALTDSILNQIQVNQSYYTGSQGNQEEFKQAVRQEISKQSENFNGSEYWDGSSFDVQGLLDDYNEYTGKNVKQTLTGFKDGDVQVEWEDIIREVATYKATTTENINKVSSEINEIFLQMETQFGELSSIASKLKQDLDQQTMNLLSSQDIDSLRTKIEDLDEQVVSNLFNKQKDVLLDQLNTYQKSLEQYPRQLAAQMPRIVAESFHQIDTSKMSKEAQDIIAQYLKDGIVGAGKGGLRGTRDILQDLDSEQVQVFDGLVQQLDFSTLSVDQFKEKLNESGIQINATDASLQKFIEAMKTIAQTQINPEQTYKDVHDIVDDLKPGDIIDAESIEKLEKAGIETDKYFSLLADGTSKFTGDVDEFYKLANEASLQGFKDQIDSLRQSYSTLGYNENRKYSFDYLNSSNIDIKRNAPVRIDEEKARAQIDLLNISGFDPTQIAAWNAESEVTYKMAMQINKAMKDLNLTEESYNVMLDQGVAKIQQYGSQLANSATSIQELDQLYKQGYISISDYTEAYQNLDQAMDLEGLDLEELEEYSNYLQDISDEVEGLSDGLEENEEAAQIVAKSIMKMNDGIQTLAQNWEVWGDVLANSSDESEQFFDAIDGTREALSDLLDVSSDYVSNDFIKQHLEEITAAATGDENAIQSLKNALSQDIIAQIVVENGLDENTQNALIQQVRMLQTEIPDIEVGAEINTDNLSGSEEQFINACQKIVAEAGMTVDQANAFFDSMGFEAKFKTVSQPVQKVGRAVVHATRPLGEQSIQTVTVGPGGSRITTVTHVPSYEEYTYPGSQYKYTDYVDAFALSTDGSTPQIESLTRKATPSYSNYSSSNKGGSKGKSSGGSKGKSGGSGSTKQPTQVKPVESSVKKSEVTPDFDPYEQVDKQYERQSDIVDDLQKKEKKLVNKDRLKNLQDQNKALEKQADIIQDKLDISNNKAVKNTAAWFADQIQTSFDNVKFDPDGQLSDRNALEQQAADSYNARADAQVAALKKAEDEYNSWLVNVYNKASAAQQENLKNEKERRQNSYKEIERQTKERLDTLKKEYDERLKLLDSYDKEWQMQQKLKDQLEDIKDQMYEIRIAASKIKVDLSIEAGEFERDWLDFEKKFIKKISGDDFLGSAKASVKDLMSYFNTRQIQSVADQIKTINNEIAIMSRGGTSSIYGTNMNQAKADLEEYMKQQMDDLQAIQDKVDEIRQNYLDALDDAKDKMDKQIDQYERVNDLINHNVRLTQLLYGDKAYDTMNKYYDLQKTNNEQELNSLRQQQLYWQNLMKNEDVGSDSYKVMQENLDDVTDKLNSKLEEMIQNLSDQWQNRVDGIIDKLNNAMTGGRGLDYLDEQWDYINNYDDQFLDPVESRMGIQEVQSLYQQAIDGLAGSPRQQQKINSLMEDQLKLLREKDHLTEYDIERAKASLEVEKARLALEEARDNKTKMRLRRDSQGNYTYQYVADEEKLNDLQSALADAQANLYNTDKQHYKQNLNNLYDAYKDYIKKMRQLTAAYNATQDEEERARIQARIDLLKDSTAKLMQGFTEDNQYLYTKYLTQSTLAGLGLDSSQFNADQMLEIVNQTVPQASSNIQDLANTIVKEGGILPATKEMIDEIANATLQYDADVKSILSDAGTSLNTVAEVVDAHGNALDKNIQDAQKVITSNQELIQSCQAQVVAMQKMLSYVDQLMDKVLNVNQIINNLRTAYNTDQALNGYSNITADKIPVTDFITDTTTGTNYTGNPKTDMASIKQQINQLMAQYEKFLQDMTIATFDTGGSTGTWGDAEGRLAFLHQKELVLNETDTANILKAVEAVRMITNALSNSAIEGLSSIIKDSLGLTNSLNTHDQLEQDVHIEANFPNVTQHTEIEQAFNNLVNMASMRASKYKD